MPLPLFINVMAIIFLIIILIFFVIIIINRKRISLNKPPLNPYLIIIISFILIVIGIAINNIFDETLTDLELTYTIIFSIIVGIIICLISIRIFKQQSISQPRKIE
ncbi:MAG: hypothetical protein ACFFBP_23900 [Promethearchaeota archaeon]